MYGKYSNALVAIMHQAFDDRHSRRVGPKDFNRPHRPLFLCPQGCKAKGEPRALWQKWSDLVGVVSRGPPAPEGFALQPPDDPPMNGGLRNGSHKSDYRQ